MAKLAAAGGFTTDAQWAVDGWAGEVACWTYGTINDPIRGGGTEKCDPSCYEPMMSDGCGHYTQIIWSTTTKVGCGVSSCMQGGFMIDILDLQYSAAGNIVGQAPY